MNLLLPFDCHHHHDGSKSLPEPKDSIFSNLVKRKSVIGSENFLDNPTKRAIIGLVEKELTNVGTEAVDDERKKHRFQACGSVWNVLPTNR